MIFLSPTFVVAFDGNDTTTDAVVCLLTDGRRCLLNVSITADDCAAM